MSLKILPVVAIVGRPNVGKSTAFNAFCRRKKAIESPVAGTTRDAVFEKIRGENFDFLLADTAGIFDEKFFSVDFLNFEIQKGVKQ